MQILLESRNFLFTENLKKRKRWSSYYFSAVLALLLSVVQVADSNAGWNSGDVRVTNLNYGEVNPSIASTPTGDLYMAVERLGDTRIFIYKSTDNGETWVEFFSQSDLDPDVEIIDSHNPSLVYVQKGLEQWLCVVYERVETGDTRTVRSLRVNPENAAEYHFVSIESGITMGGTRDRIYPRIGTDNIEDPDNPYLYVTYALYGADYYPVKFARSKNMGEGWVDLDEVPDSKEDVSSPRQPTPRRPDIAYGSSGLFITFKKRVWTDAAADNMDQVESVAKTLQGESQVSYEVSDDGLFSTADVSTQLDIQGKTTTKRQRLVVVNPSNLGSRRTPAQSIKLHLFEDTSFTATFIRSETNVLGSYAWVGKLDGIPLSQAVLVMTNGVLSGSVSMPGASYLISPMATGDLYLVEETNQSAYPPELPPVEVPSFLLDAAEEADVAGDDLCAEIKVLVAYTPEARDADGGTANILARIALAVVETNQSYANSGMGQRIVLAGTLLTSDGDAANDFGIDLAALQDTTDGVFTNVDTQRDALYADMVSLLIDNAEYCGEGIMNSTADSAFSVVHWDCATGNYSFGHELGHNMGARHDWYMDATLNSPYSYNKGFVNVADKWRTIMAYNDVCEASGGSCTRLPYWSNPDVFYGDFPVGISPTGPTNCVAGSMTPDPSSCAADNYQVLSTTCSTVANFRQDPVVTGSWNDQVFVTKSDDYGVSWRGSAIQLATDIQSIEYATDKYHPRIAASHGGSNSVLVAFTLYWPDTVDTDVYSCSSVDGGETWCLEPISLPSSYADEKGVDLDVSVSSEGVFHAVYWQDYSTLHITAPVSDPTSWNPPTASPTYVTEDYTASSLYFNPSVAVNPSLLLDEEAAVAWTDFRDTAHYDYGVYFDAPFSMSTLMKTGKFLPAIYLMLLMNK